jgi:hypothetical protein
MLELPNREVTPVEEEDLCLAGLFWLPPDPEDHLHPVPPSASAPEPSRSKRVLSIAGYYAVLVGQSPRKPRKYTPLSTPIASLNLQITPP